MHTHPAASISKKLKVEQNISRQMIFPGILHSPPKSALPPAFPAQHQTKQTANTQQKNQNEDKRQATSKTMNGDDLHGTLKLVRPFSLSFYRNLL
jgi:hypothetical protein